MRARVLRSIHAIAEADWDRLCGADPVFRHAWFRALEQSGVVDVEPRHIVLDGPRGPRAILPCFVQRGDPYATLRQRVLGPLGRLLPGRSLVAYSPLAQRTELFLGPDTDGAQAASAACEAMEEVCRNESIALSSWLFVGRECAALERSLVASGHHPAFLAPRARWWNPPYASFEGYVESFKQRSRRRYKDLRHELNRFARSGVLLRDAPLGEQPAALLAELQARHYARHNAGATGPFDARFFESLARELGDTARIHTATRDGELLSFSVVLCGERRWHMFLSGDRDLESAHADKLHFNLNYYFPIRLAIEQGAKELDYGLSSDRTKLQRGCVLEPLRLFVRAHSPLLRAALPTWLRGLDWHYRRKHAHLPLCPDRTASDAWRMAS